MSNEMDSKPEAGARDEKPKLKVTDRRMFDAQGNPRQPDVDRDEVSSEAPPAAAAAAVEETREVDAGTEPATPDGDTSLPPVADATASAKAAEDTTPAPAVEKHEAAAPSEAEPTSGGSYADLPRGFAPFIESQYLEALIFLGAVPHPQTGETIEDIEFARYKVDLLTMIQEKTAGNLSTEEKKLLEDVLYQLRMLFVQKTGPAAP